MLARNRRLAIAGLIAAAAIAVPTARIGVRVRFTVPQASATAGVRRSRQVRGSQQVRGAVPAARRWPRRRASARTDCRPD